MLASASFVSGFSRHSIRLLEALDLSGYDLVRDRAGTAPPREGRGFKYDLRADQELLAQMEVATASTFASELGIHEQAARRRLNFLVRRGLAARQRIVRAWVYRAAPL